MKKTNLKCNCKFLIFSVMLFLVLPCTLLAQFSLTGEFRPRAELSKGYKSLAIEDQKASLMTTQRTRLNGMFKNEYVATKLVLQDVRLWGSQSQLVKNEDMAVSVHEAWAEVMFNEELSLKAGRQEVIYDDHRIFGSVGWAQQARSHDMFLFKYKNGIDIHAGFAFHQNGEANNSHFDGNDAYKSLQFLWLHNEWDASKFSFMILNNGVGEPSGGLTNIQSQDVMYSQTIGGRFETGLDAVKVAANAYVQTGKDKADRDLSAYNVLLEVSGKLSESTGITGGIEVLSGTGYDEEVDKNKSFTPFYGTNHKFNGFMDYFYVGNHMNDVGLTDIYAKFSHKVDKLTFGGHIHYFASSAEIAEGADKGLGTEVDLSLGWAFKPMAKFSFGWSTLFASESMQLLKGGDDSAFQQWGYVMLTVTPSFIK